MTALSISRAWDETKARIAADGRLMAVVAAALIALPTLVTGVFNPGRSGDGSLWTLLVMFVAALLAIVGQLAIIRLAIGPAVSVAEAIRHGARRMPIYFVAGFLIVIAMVVAGLPFLAVLFVTGVPLQDPAAFQSSIAIVLGLLYLALIIFVAVRMLMASPVASEEAAGPIEILRRSWQLTEGHWWRLFGFILMFLIGAIILLAAVGAAVGVIAVMLFGPIEPMSGSALLVASVDAVVNAAITTLLAVMLARIYLQLSGVDSLDVTVPRTGT
jgi:membrane-anchored glycerophosphoryl diester phosphodiesterase (GDPDase)